MNTDVSIRVLPRVMVATINARITVKEHVVADVTTHVPERAMEHVVGIVRQVAIMNVKILVQLRVLMCRARLHLKMIINILRNLPVLPRVAVQNVRIPVRQLVRQVVKIHAKQLVKKHARQLVKTRVQQVVKILAKLGVRKDVLDVKERVQEVVLVGVIRLVQIRAIFHAIVVPALVKIPVMHRA